MKKVMMVSLLTAAMFIIGCGGAVELDAPEIDTVVMNATSVTVGWIVDTAVEEDPDFSGYNVYVYTDSTELLVDNGEDLNKDNATVITGNTYTIADLDDTLMYFIQVRTVNVDEKVGGYNLDVPFVQASPRPEFTATVKFELNTPGIDDNCAIKFSDATIMADSAMVSGGADMWVDVWPTSTEDTVAFDSPSHSTQWGTGARITAFVNMGQMGLDDLSEVTTEPDDTAYVEIATGDLVVAKTEDGNYVKIHVDDIDKTLDEVTITYAYQNIPDYPFFSKGVLKNQD